MIFWEMYRYGKRNGENPQDIVKDMKIFYNREIKETLPNRGEEITEMHVRDISTLLDHICAETICFREKLRLPTVFKQQHPAATSCHTVGVSEQQCAELQHKMFCNNNNVLCELISYSR